MVMDAWAAQASNHGSTEAAWAARARWDHDLNLRLGAVCMVQANVG